MKNGRGIFLKTMEAQQPFLRVRDYIRWLLTAGICLAIALGNELMLRCAVIALIVLVEVATMMLRYKKRS